MRNRVAKLRERMGLDRAGLAAALGVSEDVTARVCACAEGGQILVSESVATAETLEDAGHRELPGVGERRLNLPR